MHPVLIATTEYLESLENQGYLLRTTARHEGKKAPSPTGTIQSSTIQSHAR
jgi:hypothetical protein